MLQTLDTLISSVFKRLLQAVPVTHTQTHTIKQLFTEFYELQQSKLEALSPSSDIRSRFNGVTECYARNNDMQINRCQYRLDG